MERFPAAARVKPGGLVVAAVGFLLTRYAVAAALRMDVRTAAFVLGEAPFLVLGLTLSTFGVALTVSARDGEYVRTVTTWCLLGVGGIGALLALVETEAMLTAMASGLRTESVPRLLLGGAVGGTITGVYSARNLEQRASLSNRTDRLTVLNRVLRHEVLNKLTAVRGYAESDHPERTDRIRRNADRIEAAISQVGLLAGTDDPRAVVDLGRVTDEAVAAARERHPEATFEASTVPVDVRATHRMDTVLKHLLDNAVDHAETEAPHVAVTVEAGGASARVTVHDEGPGMSADQREAFVNGDLPRFDDPTAGFGLAITRLLLDEADAAVSVREDDGTAVTLGFARATGGGAEGVDERTLAKATAASLVAGVGYGLLLAATGDSMPIIGALYGAENAVVGWVTHLFHSVVFGLGFAALVTHPQFSHYLRRRGATVAAGAAYGVLLAVVAGGVVMPLWLRAVGIPAPLPTVSVGGIAGHVFWGGLLGGLFSWGRRRGWVER
jgi:signal transduction histidine kinase